MDHELLIIGGGASGITAAILAKDQGQDAAILEGSDRVLKKLLTTGNGRCNITNRYIESSRYHSENPLFIESILNSFRMEETADFFTSLGLPLVTLEDGKMYPMSLQASSVLDILRFAVKDRDIPVYLNNKVKNIKPYKDHFQITTAANDVFTSRKIILCAGGKSLPSTGSDGSGYILAKNLGHTIIKPIPSLVQLKLSYNHLKALSGVKFNGVAEILVENESKRREFGEILFTDYGISGPPILQLSRIASYNLEKSKEVKIRVNMLYNFNEEELENFFETHFSLFFHRSVHDAFIGIINKKIIPVLLKEAGITDIHKPCSSLDWKEKKSLYSLLKCWDFKVTDTNSFANAQVTAGGIDTKEVDPDTLESKLVPNLFFAGEILDVDGDCGGFNLQWAWSTAYLAAKGAAVK